MRIVYLLAWACFFVALVALSRCPGPESGVVAARNLKANQPLKEGDVTLEDTDLFVLRDIPRGTAIRKQDVAHWPRVAVKAGKLGVAVPLPPGSDIKAGEPVLFCPPGPRPDKVVPAAILCSPDRKACTAILDLSPEQAKALADQQAAGRAKVLSRSC